MLVDPESSPALRDLSAASREELTLKEIKKNDPDLVPESSFWFVADRLSAERFSCEAIYRGEAGEQENLR